MRTDAKIGFAIGGVLLAVLTVYAIVVPKHKKTTANTVTLVTPPAQSTNNNNDVNPVSPPMTVMADPLIPSAKEKDVVPPAPVPSPTPEAPAIPQVASKTGNLSEDGVFHPASKIDNTKVDDQKNPGPVVDVLPETPAVPHTKTPRGKTAKQPAPTPDDAVASADAHPYTIKSGETLSSIASDVYGNSRFWVAIQRENKGLDANHLKVGAKILLPDISPLRPGPMMVADEEVATPAPTHAVALPKNAHTYVVKSGDSLYGICKKLFGTGHKADALYALNKDAIGPDKSKLKLGMVLRLPDNAAMAAAN